MSVRENWKQVKPTCLKWDGHFTSHDPFKSGFLKRCVTICRKSLKLDSKLEEKRIPRKLQMTCGELETQRENECSPGLSGCTKFQVQGFFSRLSARQRLTGRKEITRDEVNDDLDEETEEEHASRQDENVFDEIHDAVVSETGVIHLVMYNVYNLCEMVAENKLSSVKVKMLREICTYFEIRF